MADLTTQDLESRIALLQGQIQRQKVYLSTTGRGGLHQPNYRTSPIYHPYYPRLPASHKSNTSSKDVKGKPVTDQVTNTKDSSSGWIATPTRNAQIISSAAYDPAAARDRALDPVTKLRQQIQPINRKHNSSSLERLLSIDGIQYSVQARGSKLVRVGGAVDNGIAKENVLPTPKRMVISGIPFLRSKNGNLYRQSVVKKHGNNTGGAAKSELCKRFTNTGSCVYGPKCAFIHDPAKVAVCREFLRSASCPQGQHCDLSHDLTYERVPACVHFVRGGCTKEKCPYPHVRVNPAAPVCRTFTSLGYCSRGIECTDKHVFECPDYAEGKCNNPKCRLPHIDRAGQLRQHNNHTASQSTARNDQMKLKNSDYLITEESASDIDSEDEVMMDAIDKSFSQEHDFLSF